MSRVSSPALRPFAPALVPAALATLAVTASELHAMPTAHAPVPAPRVIDVEVDADTAADAATDTGAARATVAVELRGASGPLVVAVPGLGDLRSEYRFLADTLVERGFRVALVDLRGHGGSSARVTDASAAAAGRDLIAVLRALGGEPAAVVGTSFGAAAAVYAAGTAPELVSRVVLIGPAVFHTEPSAFLRAAMTVLFGGPWRVHAWAAYYDSLYPSRKPADHAAHLDAIKANLAEPGRFEAVAGMMRVGRKEIEAVMPNVKAPVLVVMGTKDADFPVPAEEARRIADALRGEVFIVEGAGHYPHVEMPEPTGDAIARFLAGRP